MTKLGGYQSVDTTVNVKVAGRSHRVLFVRTPYDMPAPTNRAPVIVDIETNALPVYDPDFQVRTVQINSPAWDSAYVIPCRVEFYPQLDAILEAAPVLVAHHAMVEWQGLCRAGLFTDPQRYWPKTVDSMLMVAVISHPRGPTGDVRLGLKENTRALVDADYDMDRQLKELMKEGYREFTGECYKSGARKGEQKTKHHRYNWATVPMDAPVYLQYAAGDVIAPHYLLETLFAAGYSAAGEHYKKARDLSMLMQRRIARGLEVDEEALIKAETGLEASTKEPVALLLANGVDPSKGYTGANKAVLVEALERAGIKPPMTKGGDNSEPEPSLGQDAVFLAADGKPLPPVLTAWYAKERAAKFKGAYLDLFRDGLENGGVVHPEIRIMQAATGRTSVAKPPLQQLPRIGDTRGCLRAKAGHVLVGADLSQIEPRIAGALSGDVNLLGAISAGIKMHVIVAKRMFGDHYSDEQYNLAKTAGLAWLYGGGKTTIAKQTGVSQKVSGGLVKALEQSFPQIVQYKEHLAGQDRVTTRYGREIQLDSRRPWSKMNYEIQGSAYDLFTAGTLRAAEALGPDAIWLTVHDEVLAEVPEEDAEYSAHVLGEALSTEFMGIPCPAIGTVVGRNWRKT